MQKRDYNGTFEGWAEGKNVCGDSTRTWHLMLTDSSWTRPACRRNRMAFPVIETFPTHPCGTCRVIAKAQGVPWERPPQRKDPMPEEKFRWATPYEWFAHWLQTHETEDIVSVTKELAQQVGFDALQDLFQEEMSEDGYFEPLKPEEQQEGGCQLDQTSLS